MPRTATARTVPREGSHGPLVGLLDVETFTLEPDSEMRDAAQMQPRHVGVVASPNELTFVVAEKRHEALRPDGRHPGNRFGIRIHVCPP